MANRRPPALAALTACILLMAFGPAPARADFIVELTTHETTDGPATTNITTCSFYVKGVGLLEQTGTIRFFQGEMSPVEVGSVAFMGTVNGDGLFDVVVGPVDLGANHADLIATIDYAGEGYPSLSTSPFQTHCTRVSSSPACASSFLPPLHTPGHARAGEPERFKFGQTVPVKLDVLCDPDPDAPMRLYVAKSVGGVLDPERPGMTSSAAYTENILNRNGNHWQYNLDTSHMTRGVWKVRVAISDGYDQTVWLDLR